MKRLILLALHSSLLALPSSLLAAEVVVYSPPSESPLHVSAVSGAPRAAFTPSYTGHRSVCVVPGASASDAFVAWTGGDAYRVGDPFGCSTGRGSCAVELEPVSAIMPRFDLFTGSADRVRTVQDVYDKIIADILNLNLSPSSLEKALADVSWMASNRIEMVTVPKPGEEARVRVVRWLIDGKPVWRCGVYPRVVVDKRFEYREGAALTEADILSDTCFDLDWEDFGSVVTNRGVRDEGLTVSDMCYLVVLGDGKVSHRGMSDTNTVNAFPSVIWRRYGTNHVQAVALPSGAQPLSHPLFRFRADCPALERYTACQLQVTSDNGSVTNWTSGTVRIPPRDATGAYVYSAPDLGDTGISTNGTYSWRAIVYNSKFNERTEGHEPVGILKWSDPVPVTFTANE